MYTHRVRIMGVYEMNTQEFIETLVDDGLDNSTIIDYVKTQDKLIDALETVAWQSFHKEACSWGASVSEAVKYANEQLETLRGNQ